MSAAFLYSSDTFLFPPATDLIVTAVTSRGLNLGAPNSTTWNVVALNSPELHR